MNGRVVRSDFKRDLYAQIVSTDPGGTRPISIRGPGALTMFEKLERERRKPCRIFRGSGETCERPGCGHPHAAHAFVWGAAR